MKCVFADTECVKPELIGTCISDIRVFQLLEQIDILRGVLDAIDVENMARIHYASGEKSPAHDCPIYRMVFRKKKTE